MLDGIIDLLLWIMNATHFVTRTWVIDIILLTIIVRLVMYPLNRQMNRSMKIMQKLQPEMKALQAKYKDKPDVQQKEMMELYRKYKVNPLSSCWPLMIQMPIFIALFWALRDPRFYLRLPGFTYATVFGTYLTIPPYLPHPSPEVALAPGVLDLYNLFNIPFFADKFFYLPSLWLVVLYIATTIIQSKQMQSQSQATSSGTPNMSTMMIPMFILIGMLFPTGLLVYFITSNLLQMAQYWRIQREIAVEEAVGTGPDLTTGNGGSKPKSDKGKPAAPGVVASDKNTQNGRIKKKK